MNKRVGAGVIGIGLLALSVGIFVSGQNAGQARTLDADTNKQVLKLAAAIKAGNKDEVKKLAAALAKEDLEEGMAAFRPRWRGGLGVGREKGKITPDGMELKLQNMGRDAPSGAILGKEAEALEEMAYVIAAVAEVAAIKGTKDAKGKADWAP